MDHPGRGERDPDLQDDLPGEGRTAEMSSGRVTGNSGDEDGNAGALCAPSCPQHRGDSVESKLPPPTVRPMQHAGPQAGLERMAPGHGTVCTRGRAEEMTACGGEDAGEFGAGLQGAYQECVIF